MRLPFSQNRLAPGPCAHVFSTIVYNGNSPEILAPIAGAHALQHPVTILYHHRTRATDAQRIHILEIIRAFGELGHEVKESALVSVHTQPENAERDASEAGWRTLLRRLPGAYDLVQLAYNAVGIPLLMMGCLRWRPAFIYERYSLLNFVGVLTAKLLGLPIVLEVNSPFALEQERDKDIRWIGLARWSERVICNSATRVIVISSALRRMMIASGVSPDKLVVMANGVNRDHFRSSQPDPGLRRQLGLDDRVVFGYAGWFRGWHRLDLLLEAFHRAEFGGKGAALLLIGDGPEMDKLRQFERAHDFSGPVVFAGPVPHSRIPAYLDLVDVAVLPAANEYCCPMKILEYLALGKPVVAPRQDNITELIREDSECLLFTPGDPASLAEAMARLGVDPALRARMGRTAMRLIEERGFLWTCNASRVLELVQQGEL